MSADIGVVVVRYRGGDEADRCLASLRARGGPRLARTVLVDSGSGDGGAERLEQAFPDTTVVALEQNLSFAHAANEGVALLDTPLVLLLNPDTDVEEGALSLLADQLDRRPATAGAVPLLIGRDGAPQLRWQLRRLPGRPRLALGLPGRPAFARPPAAPAMVAQPAASCWLIRCPVWEALGGFDESFVPAWWEDVELCARLRDGLRRGSVPAREGFIVVPAARVIHQGGSSARTVGDARFLPAYFTNLVRFARRRYPKSSAAIATSVRLGLLARAALRPARRAAYLEAARRLRVRGGE